MTRIRHPIFKLHYAKFAKVLKNMVIQKILNRLDRQSLNTKLLLIIGFAYLMTVAVGIQSIVAINILKNNIIQSYDIDLLGISHIQQAQLNLVNIDRALRKMAMSSNSTERFEAKKALDVAEIGVKNELMDANNRPTMFSAEKFSHFDTLFVSFSGSVRQISTFLSKSEVFSDGQSIDLFVNAEFNRKINATENALTDIANFKQAEAKKSSELNEEMAVQLKQQMFWLLSFGLIGSIVISGLIVHSIHHPFNALNTSVENLAKGRLNIVVPYTDYTNEIGNMAASLKILQSVAKTLDAERWAKGHEVNLSSELQQSKHVAILSQKFISTVCPLLKALHGLLYVKQDGMLQLTANYGYTDLKTLKQTFQFGEGMIGQCAMEKNPITLSKLPKNYVTIRSGLGESEPKDIFLLPIIHVSEVVAVLELAFMENLGEREKLLLEGLKPILATALYISLRNAKIQSFL